MCRVSRHVSISGHQTALALRLAKHVASGVDGRGNVAISPISVTVALALLAAGAKGETLDELVSLLVGPHGAAADLDALATQIIARVLAEGSVDGGPVLFCSNAVFADAALTLLPSFEEVVTGTYNSGTQAVDFTNKSDQVLETINSWVERVTGGLITELLPPGSIHADTRLVLANAIYFKAAWSDKFDPSETRDSEFHLLDGTSVQVPCMTSGDDKFVCSYGGFKALRLPYAMNGDVRQFSMCIFLPDARDGIWRLQERMSSEPEFLSCHPTANAVPVGEFKLPKFQISFGLEATQVLKDLGVVSAFSMDDADFSRMVDYSSFGGGGRLCVAAVRHKSFVQVDEGGTEAAAATEEDLVKGLAFGGVEELPAPVDFVADHPFIFLIVEDYEEVILFAGHVTNPLLN